MALLQTWYNIPMADVRYCDIGANHPKALNNTFAIYERGGSGLLVEPNPDLISDLKKHRPRDVVINAGVAFDERRSAKLQRLTSSVFSTFSKEHAEFVSDSSKNWQPYQHQSLIDEIEIPLVPLNELLEEHFTDQLHYISIDAEGVDFQILQSMDLERFRPKIICIEGDESLDDFLHPRGYLRTSQTPDNVIYRIVS